MYASTDTLSVDCRSKSFVGWMSWVNLYQLAFGAQPLPRCRWGLHRRYPITYNDLKDTWSSLAIEDGSQTEIIKKCISSDVAYTLTRKETSRGDSCSQVFSWFSASQFAGTPVPAGFTQRRRKYYNIFLMKETEPRLYHSKELRTYWGPDDPDSLSTVR